jgi:uncharacterized membrane protein YqiK
MFFMGIRVEILVVAGLMVLIILFLTSMLARLYRKAGPHEALIVYGFRGTRVVQGHGTKTARTSRSNSCRST